MGYEGVRWAEPKRRREKRGWAAFCLQAAVLAAFVFVATWMIWG